MSVQRDGVDRLAFDIRHGDERLWREKDATLIRRIDGEAVGVIGGWGIGPRIAERIVC